MNVLAQLVCSRVRAEIFRVLFGVCSDRLHLREIQRRTGFALATVRQDIEKLAELGVVVRSEDGNRVYYAANDKHPLTSEIRQLTLKTLALTDVLAEALTTADVRCAFVFGSIANSSAVAESDIDLMILGDIGLRKVSSLLSGAGAQLGREINPMILDPREFRKRVREKEHFIFSVMKAPKVFVIGSPDDLEAMAR